LVPLPTQLSENVDTRITASLTRQFQVAFTPSAKPPLEGTLKLNLPVANVPVGWLP
jgi:hypothetical protein